MTKRLSVRFPTMHSCPADDEHSYTAVGL